jgi:hypothetical protein
MSDISVKTFKPDPNFSALYADPFTGIREMMNISFRAVKSTITYPGNTIILLLFLFIPFNVYSQNEKHSEFISEIAEQLASDESDAEAAALFIDLLQELSENPVEINTKDYKELSRLFFLSDFQIKALADYIRSSGKILSPFEIANIPGFDRETTEMMIPFITLNIRNRLLPDSASFRSSLLSNLTFRTSDKDTSAPGSPEKLLTKYRFNSGNVSGGFTTEKDQGEKYFNGNLPMPDFLSANIAISGNGLIRKIIIGDYSARFGLGTNINTGIRTGISLTTPGNISGRDEVKPYTSSDENNYLRGIASEFQVNNLHMTLFYSVNKTDATLNTTDGLSNNYIESFYKTGLHNSTLSLLKKDVTTESYFGANLSYIINNSKFGFMFSQTRFSLPVNIYGNNPDDIYDFQGNRNQIATVSYRTLVKRMIFYGEVSADIRGKIAVVQGSVLRPSDRLIINILFRYLEPGYTAFHANSPGSSSSGNNLKGFLGSFSFEAAKYLFINAGCDLQYFPWMKYRCGSPSMARKEEVRIKYIPSEKFSAEIFYYERYSMLDNQETGGIPKQEKITSHAVKCLAKFSPQQGLTLGTRIDFKFVEPGSSKGMLMLQDINYRFGSVPLSLFFRYCIFNTSSWESRLYTWENDLLYSFSIPVLSGEGSRSYIVAGWKIWDDAELRVKYGITTLTENINLQENTEEIRLQFRLRF